jgi:hypothetical protein
MFKFLRIYFLVLLFTCWVSEGIGQQLISKRSTFYTIAGTSGAQLNQFNALLNSRGFPGLQDRYQTIGIGYQTRINDFVMGMELLQNQSKKSQLDSYLISYRTSRAMMNIGYAFTEESRFQLIHYMSLGVGFLNFQMIPEKEITNLQGFLSDPASGFVLRKGDIHKGSTNFDNFLTEIGFHLSYDFDMKGREEALQVVARMGYSFSPFESKWDLAGMAFDNTQSGAFLRLGAGISLPDRNFFYKDASIGIHFIHVNHFTSPNELNQQLKLAGYNPLEGRPSNLGLRILGNTEKLLYGVEVYNLSQKGKANLTHSQTLNSLRVYGNAGYKFFQFKGLGIGGLTGFGLGNLRYTISQNQKPEFTTLFEERDFDGYLTKTGLMIKPELFVDYEIPMTKRKFFDLVLTSSAGYELPVGRYRLGEISMANYLAGPYLSLGIGIKP